MYTEKAIPLIKGLIWSIPGINLLKPLKTGGTCDSRYCYSVWIRHFKHWSNYNDNIPEVVAELGPGDSLGIGLAALLTGSKRIISLDIIRYWNVEKNIRIFNELVDLFKSRSAIPDKDEYPRIKPEINDLKFPSDLLSSDQMNKYLSEDRLNKIRNELADIYNPENSFVNIHIPWDDDKVIIPSSVDFLVSQAVLEHVNELEFTYSAMSKWLKRGAYMSHTIDLKSHGITNSWNGHWLFNEAEWNIVKGKKKTSINRLPFSVHRNYHNDNSLRVIEINTFKAENKLNRRKLSEEFRDLSESDITTCGAYILSQKIS